MSETTKIEWCDATFNPWIGCAKVSPGCAHCYAEQSTPSRAFGVEWGKGKERRRTSEANWELPRRWNRAGGAVGTPRPTRPRVFCASLADWLDDEVPIEWLADLLKLIHETPNLDWLLLTKRPGNWRDRLMAVEVLWARRTQMGLLPTAREQFNMVDDWLKGRVLPNVWFGVSVEDQARARERGPVLMKIPARVRFVSVEPLLGPLDLKLGLSRDPMNPDWVIVGGESGPKARTCHVEWVRSVVGQCRAAGVACFVKQLGSEPYSGDNRDFHCEPGDDEVEWQPRYKHPKGGDMEEWAEDVRVREFPRFDVQSSKLDVGSS